MGKELLTSVEVARIAGVARGTVNGWVRRGQLKPAYRAVSRGGINLFDPDDVARLVAARAA